MKKSYIHHIDRNRVNNDINNIVEISMPIATIDDVNKNGRVYSRQLLELGLNKLSDDIARSNNTTDIGILHSDEKSKMLTQKPIWENDIIKEDTGKEI